MVAWTAAFLEGHGDNLCGPLSSLWPYAIFQAVFFAAYVNTRWGNSDQSNFSFLKVSS
jgi:hypothetical protein